MGTAHQQSRYQVRSEEGKVVAASDSRNGIDAFLDRFADGTPGADYEVMTNRKDEAGNTIFVVRSI